MGNRANTKKIAKKTNIVSHLAKKFVAYFNDVRSEVKKITWLDRKQLINNTVVVLGFCLFFGIMIWLIDGVVGKLRNFIYGL